MKIFKATFFLLPESIVYFLNNIIGILSKMGKR